MNMLIYAIDDERKALSLLHGCIQEVLPGAQIRDFLRAPEAVEALRNEDEPPAVIFSDIRMPGMDGLELAAALKEMSPESKIVFVTGYDDYAMDAWRVQAGGYILKPVDACQIRKVLSGISRSYIPEMEKLQVRCFGYFGVFWKGEPLNFERRQTLELFAWLINRRGAMSTSEETISVLWEDVDDVQKAMHRLRNLTGDLARTLDKIGQADVLIRRRGMAGVRTDMVDCDYYRMLEGDVSAVNAFRGKYMEQYSWAELTKGSLYFGALEN